MAEKRRKTTEVRAKVTHIQPGSLIYREAGQKFSHEGELYKHVEPVKAAEEDEAGPDGVDLDPAS